MVFSSKEKVAYPLSSILKEVHAKKGSVNYNLSIDKVYMHRVEKKNKKKVVHNVFHQETSTKNCSISAIVALKDGLQFKCKKSESIILPIGYIIFFDSSKEDVIVSSSVSIDYINIDFKCYRNEKVVIPKRIKMKFFPDESYFIIKLNLKQKAMKKCLNFVKKLKGMEPIFGDTLDMSIKYIEEIPNSCFWIYI